jgi:hypothetical protein
MMADFLPINARFFLDSLQGKTDKITEKDFSPEEIQTLREIGNTKFRPYGSTKGFDPETIAAVEKMQREPQVGYVDYSPNPDRRNAAWATLSDPRYRIATSLGNFGMKDEGDHYKVYDKYTWNGDFKEPVKSLKDLWNNPNVDKTSLTSVGNALAEIYAPKTSRPVEVRIPKKAPPKEPDVIDKIFSHPVDLIRDMFTPK